jgi:hypothetical protein
MTAMGGGPWEGPEEEHRMTDIRPAGEGNYPAEGMVNGLEGGREARHKVEAVLGEDTVGRSPAGDIRNS